MIDPAEAKRIKLVAIDVDGVLTDGGIYLGDVNGATLEFKRYDIQDGLGIRFLRQAGIKVAIITGRVSESVKIRAKELQVDYVAQDDLAMKLPSFMRILEECGIAAKDSAFVGDDFPDLAVLRVVGMPVAVGNAVPEIRKECKVQLTKHGGRGAIREFAEVLLKARGEWEKVTGDYVRERSDAGTAGAAR